MITLPHGTYTGWIGDLKVDIVYDEVCSLKFIIDGRGTIDMFASHDKIAQVEKYIRAVSRLTKCSNGDGEHKVIPKPVMVDIEIDDNATLYSFDTEEAAKAFVDANYITMGGKKIHMPNVHIFPYDLGYFLSEGHVINEDTKYVPEFPKVN